MIMHIHSALGTKSFDPADLDEIEKFINLPGNGQIDAYVRGPDVPPVFCGKPRRVMCGPLPGPHYGVNLTEEELRAQLV